MSVLYLYNILYRILQWLLSRRGHCIHYNHLEIPKKWHHGRLEEDLRENNNLEGHVLVKQMYFVHLLIIM